MLRLGLAADDPDSDPTYDVCPADERHHASREQWIADRPQKYRNE